MLNWVAILVWGFLIYHFGIGYPISIFSKKTSTRKQRLFALYSMMFSYISLPFLSGFIVVTYFKLPALPNTVVLILYSSLSLMIGGRILLERKKIIGG